MASDIGWRPPMRLRQSLRLKLGLNLALFCILFIVALTIAAYLVTESQERIMIDRIVGDEITTLAAKSKADPALRLLVEYGSSGYVVKSAADRVRLPDYLQALGAGKHELMSGGKPLYVVVREIDGAAYFLAYEVAHHRQRMADFVKLLIAAVAVSVAAALGLGLWWASRIFRRLGELAQRMDQLHPDGAGAQLGGATPDDELARLVLSFDSYQTKMWQLVEREKEFSANASHELRTPLTLIQTSCELLAQDQQLSDKSRRHVRSIAYGAEHMSELIRWFLVLAREGSLGESERVSIRECLDEVLTPLFGTLERKKLTLDMSIPAAVAVHANREALQIVLTNLLRNAAEYTDRGGITIRHLGNKLHVEDTGRGIPDGEIASIFIRFYRVETSRRGRDGLGLGLAIVKRICEHYQWSISIKSAVNAGTTVSIEFPPQSNLF